MGRVVRDKWNKKTGRNQIIKNFEGHGYKNLGLSVIGSWGTDVSTPNLIDLVKDSNLNSGVKSQK